MPSKASSTSKKYRSLHLRHIKFKRKDYALDESTNDIYDYHLAISGHAFLLGKLINRRNRRPMHIVRLNNSPKLVESAKIILSDKLDKINLNKHSKFIENEGDYYAPGGPGYLLAKSSFEGRAKTQKKRSHARTLSMPRKKSSSKSRSQKHRPKSIGGRKFNYPQ